MMLRLCFAVLSISQTAAYPVCVCLFIYAFGAFIVHNSCSNGHVWSTCQTCQIIDAARSANSSKRVFYVWHPDDSNQLILTASFFLSRTESDCDNCAVHSASLGLYSRIIHISYHFSLSLSLILHVLTVSLTRRNLVEFSDISLMLGGARWLPILLPRNTMPTIRHTLLGDVRNIFC